jgi:tetratricopeptide (TPR) repeat protein
VQSMWTALLMMAALAAPPAPPQSWEKARDAQDRAALDRIAAEALQRADANPRDANAQYLAALAESFRSGVAMEIKDRRAAGEAAEAGIRAAQRAAELAPDSAEYHRIYGTLCGQVIPANVLLGLKYGRCAMDEVNKAIELDPKSSMAWVSRAVGYYYLPPSFGGGLEEALKSVQKAVELDGGNAEAHLWLGLTLRKLNRNAEARKAFEKALSLNPDRVWIKQQLEKTPQK